MNDKSTKKTPQPKKTSKPPKRPAPHVDTMGKGSGVPNIEPKPDSQGKKEN